MVCTLPGEGFVTPEGGETAVIALETVRHLSHEVQATQLYRVFRQRQDGVGILWISNPCWIVRGKGLAEVFEAGGRDGNGVFYEQRKAF